jgi:hypothetical protein
MGSSVKVGWAIRDNTLSSAEKGEAGVLFSCLE